jgi:hypothetical protein
VLGKLFEKHFCDSTVTKKGASICKLSAMEIFCLLFVL